MSRGRSCSICGHPKLTEIIEKVNGLFEGELTDDDQLVHVNDVLKKKMMESEELRTQATNNTKAQFAASRTLSTELMNAIKDALTAHTTMSKQAWRVKGSRRDSRTCSSDRRTSTRR